MTQRARRGSRPAHKFISRKHGRLTPTAKKLYDLVYFYGLGGCWMSNETLSYKLDCSPRAIQLARRLLEERHLLITARAGNHTFSMWARYHKAVRNCEFLLFPPNRRIENPFFGF